MNNQLVLNDKGFLYHEIFDHNEIKVLISSLIANNDIYLIDKHVTY